MDGITNNNDIVAQVIITAAEEVNILPIPTNGETIPPNMKLDAPNAADAVPALFRSLSIASDVEAGNVIPRKNSNRSNELS